MRWTSRAVRQGPAATGEADEQRGPSRQLRLQFRVYAQQRITHTSVDGYPGTLPRVFMEEGWSMHSLL